MERLSGSVTEEPAGAEDKDIKTKTSKKRIQKLSRQKVRAHFVSRYCYIGLVGGI